MDEQFYHTTTTLEPEELLLAAMARLSIKDATQTKNERLRQDALHWLWWFCPSIAQRAGVPLAVNAVSLR